MEWVGVGGKCPLIVSIDDSIKPDLALLVQLSMATFCCRLDVVDSPGTVFGTVCRVSDERSGAVRRPQRRRGH